MSYANWAARVHGFVKPPSVRPSREFLRRRPWTRAERDKLPGLWSKYGQSAEVAYALKRDREDVRAAVHMMNLRSFADTAREQVRHAPAGYYVVFSDTPPTSHQYASWTST